MKKILLDGSKNFYKANLHCHSTKSDGKMTVEELKRLYMDNGYSVIAFTDHEHLVNNSHLTDSDFLAITAFELAVKEDPTVSTSVKKDMKVTHLNLYSKDPDNIDIPFYNSVYDHFINDDIKDVIYHSCPEYEREYTAECINGIIAKANELGFLVSYNHPGWSLESAVDYLRYKGLWGVEIYNNGCVKAGYSGFETFAYDHFLRAGERVACFASDDNHGTRDTCGGYVMINADRLDYKTIMTALENHDFYASTGPVIKSLYIEDGKAYITYDKGCSVTLVAGVRRAKKVAAENPSGENTAVFDVSPEDKYVRFEVADEYGNRANTNAYFL